MSPFELTARRFTDKPSRSSILKLTIFTLLSLAPTWVVAQVASFQSLGDLPGGRVESAAYDVSPNGEATVGYSYGTDDLLLGFQWDANSGMVELPDLPGGWSQCEALAVSDNGIPVGIGHERDGPATTAIRWTNGLPESLGFLTDLYLGGSRAWGISADGSVIVGASVSSQSGQTIEAFRWEDNQMAGLGGLNPNDVLSYATGVNSAGTIVVGFSTNLDDRYEAFIWQDGKMTGLGILQGSTESRAADVSNDGSIVVGNCNGNSGANNAVRFVDGNVEDLGPGFAEAVSGNGRIVVGWSGDKLAWIWDETNGMRVLKEVLESDHGLDLTGWVLLRAFGISDDGSVIVGSGIDPDGNFVAWRAVAPTDVDTDGDGLLDSWETNGLDVNGDGTIDLDLPALGADPNHKDLFVEVDGMQGVSLDPNAIDLVKSAFLTAPIDNPDNANGIKLHIDLTTADTFPTEATWDDNFVAFGAIKSLFFGTQTERDSPNWQNIRDARKRVFRYCTIINAFDSGALGWGENPGNDFMCAFGGIAANNRDLQASTFMHELGHNLNLGHGGNHANGDPDGTNYKPNYVSVMNYGFDSYSYESGQPLIIDFSREAITPLIEDNLDETIGIQSTEYSNVLVFHGFRLPGEAPQVGWVQLNTPNYDWNHDGEQQQGVVVDLNWLGPGYPDGTSPSPGETMHSQNDWQMIILPLDTDGSFADGQHIRPPFEEITEEEVILMRETIPPPPVNVADLTDVQMVTGTILEGDVNALGQTDQTHLRIRSGFGETIVDLHHMELIVGATSDIINPVLLDVMVRSHLSEADGNAQLRLRNWTSGTFDFIGSYGTSTEQSANFFTDIAAADYVGPGGEIELSIKHIVFVPYLAFTFESFIDQVQITAK